MVIINLFDPMRTKDERRDHERADRNGASEGHAQPRHGTIHTQVALVPLVLDRAGRIEQEEVRRDRRTENAHGDEPVMSLGVIGQARYGTCRNLPPVWLEQDRSDDQTECDQTKTRDAVLDEAEGALPQQHPNQKSGWNSPPLEAYAGRELKRDADPADLRCENEKVYADCYKERQQEEVEAEALANGVRDGVVTHRCEAAGHLDQKDDAYGPEDDRPEKLEAEACPGLGRCCKRAQLQEPTNARHNAQRDLQKLLHGGGLSCRPASTRAEVSRKALSWPITASWFEASKASCARPSVSMAGRSERSVEESGSEEACTDEVCCSDISSSLSRIASSVLRAKCVGTVPVSQASRAISAVPMNDRTESRWRCS